jgi:hypothetical protein
MVRISVLGDALKTMYNAEKRGKVSRSRLSWGLGISCCRRAAVVCWGVYASVYRSTWVQGSL